jgi:hypothetical protein
MTRSLANLPLDPEAEFDDARQVGIRQGAHRGIC